MSIRFLTFLMIFVDQGHVWAGLHGLGDHALDREALCYGLDRLGLDYGFRCELRCWFNKLLLSD
jgi:hypothetical protein